MILSDILKSLTKSTKRTSTELRADLTKIDLQALEANVDAIERRRRDLLLTGTDDQLRAITDELSRANLDAERGQAAVDELTRLVAEAEERERTADLEATAAEGRQAHDRLIDHYAAADQLAAALADTLAKIVADR